MANELDALPESVREANEKARAIARLLPQEQRAAFEALIDGILDLTRQKLDLATHGQEVERERDELRKERDQRFLSGRDWATQCGVQEARAERAEAELAAIKKRIAEAPIQMVPCAPTPDGLVNKRMRLLDDEAKS